MFNNMKIGTKLLIAPAVAVIFLVVLAIFSNNALKSDKQTLNEIVEKKFALYKTSSQILIDVDLYNSVLYKIFSFASGGYEQSQIDEQLKVLDNIGKKMNADLKVLLNANYVDSKTKKVVKTIEKNIKEYNLTVQDAIEMLSVDVGMATPMLSVTEEVFLLLNKDLKSIKETADKQNRESYQNALEQIDSTLYTLYTLIIVAFILSGLIILAVTNSIKKPLTEFQDGLMNFFKYLNKERDNADLININSGDELGEMATAVNNGITQIKTGVEQDKLLVNSAISCATQAQKGLLDARIEGRASNPSLNELKDVINDMMCSVEQNIKKAMDVLSHYTEYDYKPKADVSGIEGDLRALCEDVNSVGETITSMLVENKRSGMVLSQNANTLSANMEKISAAANDQAARLEETAASLEQITSNITNNTETTAKMASYGNEVKLSVEKGQMLANNTTKSMEEINEQTSAINEAITVIDQIAFQTNILSLNAAVEAATAGEAGKGFAVVAQEVRNLASRSAEAAKEIKDIVENAQHKTQEGKKAALEMIAGYEELNNNITTTIELIDNVSMASKEQSSGIIQINDAVNNLDKITQQNAQSAGEADTIASKTLDISNMIIEHADAKEFEGKDNIEIRQEATDMSYTGTERRVVEKRLKEAPTYQKNQTIKDTSSSNDEWDSF